MTDLRLDQVTFRYPAGSVPALDGVDLVIGAGERVAIVGQNGSGKSTLARLLNGLLRPTAGRVLHDGSDVAGHTVAQLARSVGLVFQSPDRQIFAGSVVAEVEFGPRNLGLRGAALEQAVADALARVGLEAARRTNPYDLGESGRRLLTLASVLAMRTAVLVLDEPTTGLDRRGTEVVRRVIADLAAEGRTVIVISHDMEFVADTFSRVVVLGLGRVVLDGPPAEVFAERSWPALRTTNLEPPLAALVGARLGIGTTPTIGSLLGALREEATLA